MHNVLVVDDLPIIVDNLSKLLSDIPSLPLRVHRACSGYEALHILEAHPIDIVVTDIRMPGMEGLELLRQIRRRWTDRKVIFLSSYDDFYYAKEVVAMGAFDYILKTESEAKLIEVVRRAATELEREQAEKRLVETANRQMRMALPHLQQACLFDLLLGRERDRAALGERFAELGIPLHAQLPVLIIIARIDSWKGAAEQPDRPALIPEVRRIVEEALAGAAVAASVPFESAKIVWFAQPPALTTSAADGGLQGRRSPEAAPPPDAPTHPAWRRLAHELRERLARAQQACMERLRLPVSFAFGEAPAAWETLEQAFAGMRLTLLKHAGERLLIVDAERGRNGSHDDAKLELREYVRASKLGLLGGLLENNQTDEFLKLFDDMMETFAQEADWPVLRLEVYHYLAAVFLHYLNVHALDREAFARIGWDGLVRFSDDMSWDEMRRYFRDLAERIFATRQEEDGPNSHYIVRKINEYVKANLHGDLSLTALADYVHLSPSYLSRLYRRITGVALTDYINEVRLEKAMALLDDRRMKVRKVAETVGYQSSLSFIRFFKKHMHLTPQMYRRLKRLANPQNGQNLHAKAQLESVKRKT
jgi:two-component system response regulator YesN